MHKLNTLLFVFLMNLTVWSPQAYSVEISTNTVFSPDAPSWLTESRVERVVNSIQKYMEWDIRKVKVIWYKDAQSFQNFHGFDSSVLAVSKKEDNSIHVGPRVNKDNFDSVFGHELVHIVLFQKYKTAIPKWLDEGLANYISKKGIVDYSWLVTQPRVNIQTLVHPFLNPSAASPSQRLEPRYHYQASTAAIEMIASKCSLNDLLQLSVGEKLVGYLSTFCQISDINADLQKWIAKKAKWSIR